MDATRRAVLGAAAALAGGATIARGIPQRDRYANAIVIDGLGAPDDPDGKDGAQSAPLSSRGAAQIRASGITAWQTTVSDVGNAPSNWDTTLGNIADFEGLIDNNPSLFVRGRRAADIRAAKASGKAALIYGTQDTAMVGPTLERLDVLSGLGVRVVQLTYNLRNLSGDGALEPANAGLSKLGRATIARIEKNKQLLDLSHGGARTIAEALASAKRPPTISHTGCRSLHDNPRNV